MWFLIKELIIFLGDLAIDLAGMKKEKRKELLAEAKADFREKLARWRKKLTRQIAKERFFLYNKM